MHWSVEECAYRVTIEANNYTTPETWLNWERCSDRQAAENGLLLALNSISQLFAADRAWLEDGNHDGLVEASGDIVPFPNRPHKRPS
jgi:thiamine biosynthesis lipoprotein ApbE